MFLDEISDVEEWEKTDHGMRRAVVGGNVRRDIDRTLEAIVYREQVRRGYAVTIGRVKEKEVDFVCQRGSQRLYVQVAYVMDIVHRYLPDFLLEAE